MTGLRGRLAAAALLAGVALASLAGGAPGGVATADGDWPSFGRTPANDRHSPLTEITPANVSRLDRAYSVDFQKLDPDVRRGQQSYPLAIGGKLYVTTNDDNVFALDGATGKVIWQYKPPNSALFKNFGIVANRGLAYCDGRLFIAQLDMKLVALRPGDGKVLGCRLGRPRRAGTRPRTTATRRRARRSARTTASSSARLARSTGSAGS